MGTKVEVNGKGIAMLSNVDLLKFAGEKSKKGHKCRSELAKRGHKETG